MLEVAELQRQGEALLETVTKRLDQVGDSIPITDLARVDKSILRMRRALESGEATELRIAIEDLHDLYVGVLPLDGAPTAQADEQPSALN
jgi:hypothetical protein